MMSDTIRARAAAVFQRALREYGARCCPVYREEKDANGVPTGNAAKIGCVYGIRYERGQTANVLADIPGVVARVDAPRISCAITGCAKQLKAGDLICYDGVWYSVVLANVQMDILTDVVLKEGAEPVGIQI